MHADERRGKKRFSLGTFLLLAPLLAVIVAFGAWIQTLMRQITGLEQRVATLEMNQPFYGLPQTSNVGVPHEIDEAMQLDATTPFPIDMHVTPTY